MSQAPLGILATTTATLGKEAELRAVQERLVEETVKEEGCIRYELNRSLDDERLTVFIEEWDSQESWDAHMAGEAIRRYRQDSQGLIADSSLHRLNVIANGR